MIARDLLLRCAVYKEVLVVELGYILTIVFLGIWLVFKIIEVTKERNSKKDTENSDKEDR